MSSRSVGTSAALALLAYAWPAAASSDHDQWRRSVIDGAFETQAYVLPDGQGYRHMTAMVSNANHELILFGGLGDGGPFPPTPMNHNVYTLDLAKAPSEREWEERSTDDVVAAPWFTSTRGFIQIDDHAYLACDDSDLNGVYRFNPVTYAFELLSLSTLGEDIDAGDCCAVGVKILNRRGHGAKAEERIYILGGRNSVRSPAPYVRYYSVTHDRWERVANLNVARSHLGCVPVRQRGKPLIYAIGGGDETRGEALRSIEVYDVIKDQWTLYENYLPEGGGRTRLGVQNLDNRYLLLIGGDASCAGGGANNICAPDRPLTTVDIIDLKYGNRLISSADYRIPQLQAPRQTPATSLRRSSGPGRGHKYVLHVIGGRTLDEEGGTDVLTTTEVLAFDRIKVPRWLADRAEPRP